MSEHKKSSLAALTLAAVGIVYGDIGTSPLYTLKTIFDPEHGLALTTFNLIGVVSLIFWGLTMIVSLKYVCLVLRADNRGEGGIMALMALALNSVTRQSKFYFPLMILGVFGATMFYGDSVITPAISVLGAIEGLEVAAPALSRYVVPLTIVVLVALYSVQRRGTAGIGRWFGPIMVIWFAALAVMGVINIIEGPQILQALNPLNAFKFMFANRFIAFVALGAVVLAFTGAEALYADMGHFGKKPIRAAWFLVCFPALALNYLGQGALLIMHPEHRGQSFLQSAGRLERVPAGDPLDHGRGDRLAGHHLRHLLDDQAGHRAGHAAAHARAAHVGKRDRPDLHSGGQLAAAGRGADRRRRLRFVGQPGRRLRHRRHRHHAVHHRADLLRHALPLAFAAGAVLRRDRFFHHHGHHAVLGQYAETAAWRLVPAAARDHTVHRDDDLAARTRTGVREPGKSTPFRWKTFCSPCSWPRPRACTAPRFSCAAKVMACRTRCCTTFRTTRCCTNAWYFLTVHILEEPWVPVAEQATVVKLGHDCYQVNIHYGFKDEPDIPSILAQCQHHGLQFEMMETSFFIARQTVISAPGGGMAPWREHLYVAMSRNARGAADYYQIPPNRVIELGTQVEI